MPNILTKIIKVNRPKVAPGSFELWRVDVVNRASIYLCVGLTPNMSIPEGVTVMCGKRARAINLLPIQRLERRLRYWLPKLARMANPLPVYWCVDSRDCDHVRGTSAHKSPSGWHYLRERDAVYGAAEGPTSVWRMSRKEYDEFQSSWRDYGSEAHENGHRHYCDY